MTEQDKEKLEQLNIVRSTFNEAPLTELPENMRSAPVQAPVVENPPVDVVAPVQPDPVTPPIEPVTPAEPVAVVPKELTDEELIAAINKRGLGQKFQAPVTKTAEQLAEEQENEKLAFALSKNITTAREYNAYVLDKADLGGLAFRQYREEAKREDPALSDEDIINDFEDRYGTKEDPTSFRFKRGQVELSKIGQAVLKDTYGKIVDIDAKFAEYKGVQEKEQTRIAKITAEIPVYKAHVEQAISSYSKFTQSVGTDRYDIEIPADKLEAVKAEFLEPGFAEQQVMAGFTPAEISAIVKAGVQTRLQDFIIEQTVAKALLAHQAGSRGIPPANAVHVTPEGIKYTEKQLVALKATFPNAEYGSN